MDPSGSTYALRRATSADADALIALETSAFTGDRLSARSLRRHILSSTATLVVATRNGALAGYALTFHRAGSRIARLYSIAVDPAHRGQGLAIQLLRDLETRACKRGCNRLRLEVRTDNTTAIRSYEREGFQVFATTLNYYEDGASALRMEKTLRDSNGKLAA